MGSVSGSSASGVTTTCFGTPDDDVWFTFVATASAHHISLTDITGSTGDMYMAVWSGPCATPVLVPNSCSDPQEYDVAGLTAGETYYLQVYTWTATPDQNSAFNGDEVVLIGRQGGEEIRVEELAALAGTIPYEILTNINTRVPRRYVG